jgi:hypothetical protein
VQTLRGGLGPGVQPHLVQLLVDSEQYGRHIELSPSVRLLDMVQLGFTGSAPPALRLLRQDVSSWGSTDFVT